MPGTNLRVTRHDGITDLYNALGTITITTPSIMEQASQSDAPMFRDQGHKLFQVLPSPEFKRMKALVATSEKLYLKSLR